MATDCIILVGPSQDTRLREAGAKVVCCLTRGAPKGPNLPRVQLNHQDALFPGHGLATHSQTFPSLKARMMNVEGKPGMSPLERWTNHWDAGSIPWQRDHLFPLLAKHQDVILAGKQDAQVYVPMSGKAPELKWFYDKGHRVVGVEFVESAARGSLVDIGLPLEEAECPVLKCKIFQVYVPMSGKAPELKWFYDKGHRVVGVEFVESAARGSLVDIGLPLEEAECPVLKCKIFQTPDKRFRIFVCNVLDFNKSCAGEMDIVWDIGALSSIKESDRDRQAGLSLWIERARIASPIDAIDSETVVPGTCA
ncbi:thiopurine S-methyltransferase [Ixodes scapularis]